MKSSSSPTESQHQRLFFHSSQKIKHDLFAPSNTQPLVRSYLFLRRGIGIIGVSLPIVLIMGKILLESPGISPSISAYYYTVMRDVFVGSLWATGIFLICYRYDRLDDIVSTIAGMCAIGVALFPTPPDVDATQRQTAIGVVHGSFASCFFLMLAFMAIVLFRKTDSSTNPTRRKQLRNTVYLICGFVIIACVVLAALFLFVPYLHGASWLQPLHLIFFLETIALFAFGCSWFVKGETFILKDSPKRDDMPQSC